MNPTDGNGRTVSQTANASIVDKIARAWAEKGVTTALTAVLNELDAKDAIIAEREMEIDRLNERVDRLENKLRAYEAYRVFKSDVFRAVKDSEPVQDIDAVEVFKVLQTKDLQIKAMGRLTEDYKNFVESAVRYFQEGRSPLGTPWFDGFKRMAEKNLDELKGSR